jgi:hypothetical protein
MGTEMSTPIDLQEKRLQFLQKIQAARSSQPIEAISQEQYEAAIRSKVSPERYAEMRRLRDQEEHKQQQPRLAKNTGTTASIADLQYYCSQQYQEDIKLHEQVEARAVKDKEEQAKLERLIIERGEPPVLYRKAKGKLSDFMMDSSEDIPTPDQLENIANEIFNIDLSEVYETDLSMILRLASKRYNLNKESAINMVVEVLSKMGINKVHENNTGKVIDFRFFRKHVYDG